MRKRSLFIITIITTLLIGTTACSSSTVDTKTLKSNHTAMTPVTTEADMLPATGAATAGNLTQSSTEASATDAKEIKKALTYLLTKISSTKTDTTASTTQLDATADTLINYVQNYGANVNLQTNTDAASEIIAKLAQKQKNSADFYNNLNDSFEAVCEAAITKDESLEGTLAYTNLVNAIDMVIYDLAPADSTEVSKDELKDCFYEMLENIYQTKNNEDNVKSVAFSFLSYIAEYGLVTSDQGYEALAEEMLKNLQTQHGANFYSDFESSLEKVSSTALSEEPFWETNLAYTNIMNGISLALNELHAN